MTISALTNKGVTILNPKNTETQKTIIVVGVARGGTSIVAGTLKHLGVFMGGAQEPVYEDSRLSLAFEKKSQEKFEQVILDYNNSHDLWAWKRPSSLHELSRVAKKLRNPHFVFVFRDLLSVANRNNISMKLGVKGALSQAFDDYQKIIKFIKKSKHPALLVSSEKAVQNKSIFIEALADLCSLNVTESQIEQAVKFISPNPSLYLNKSRIDRVDGWIDYQKLQTGFLHGWAYQARNKAQVDICIYVNDELMTTLTASEFHPNFHGKVHPTGHCGFSVDLKKHGVSVTDKIEIKRKGDEVNVFGIDLSLDNISSWLTAKEAENKVKPKGAVSLNVLQIGMLRGWALSHSYNEHARVGVYINGNKYAEIPACIARENLKKANIHPSGVCGFDFDLKLFGVKPTDELEVRLEGTEIILYIRKQMFPELTDWLTHEQLKQKNAQLQQKEQR